MHLVLWHSPKAATKHAAVADQTYVHRLLKPYLKPILERIAQIGFHFTRTFEGNLVSNNCSTCNFNVALYFSPTQYKLILRYL